MEETKETKMVCECVDCEAHGNHELHCTCDHGVCVDCEHCVVRRPAAVEAETV